MSRRFKWILIALLIIGIIAFIAWRFINPTGPVLDPVNNEIRDRATKDWTALEASVDKNPLNDVFFGDMHVHTAYSFDAYIGGTTGTPDQAYQFAQGTAIPVLGESVKIKRPLDFAAVTDHSEYLGELYTVNVPEAPGYNTLHPRVIRGIGIDTAKQQEFFLKMLRNTGNATKNHPRFFRGFETTIAAWDIALEAAEDHYKPGEFTTFAAYEWTLGIGMMHGHRNVFFRDMVVPDYPISAIEATDEEQLWQSLDGFRKDGSTVMAVPHNTNLSGGFAFPEQRADGSPIDRAYVEQRNANEPLVEIHQAKGNSEVYASFWENDEFADFENYNQGPPLINNFVRHTLKRGLKYQDEFGTNPYKYGLIGSTDSHNATPGNTEEDDDYIGNHCQIDLRAETRVSRDWILDREVKTHVAVNPGGLMAVWAPANTRSDIYDAMARKETYATSGTRIKVRFFGGYNFESRYENYDELVEDGYDKGVAMGSDISLEEQSGEFSNSRGPQFIAWASKDPINANLDRIQIIKGWYEDGDMKEKIYDVALSDERRVNVDGTVDRLTDVVDLESGAVDESLGNAELSVVWRDPDFDPSVDAFYYARVLEVETPRYSLWDEIRHGVSYPASVPKTIQERAWSSPIWYNAPR